jgi:hypothetical protein
VSGEDVHRPRDDQPEDDQRDQGLHAHGQLGSMPKRHHVGRAEGGGVRQAQVEEIEEQRLPPRRSSISSWGIPLDGHASLARSGSADALHEAAVLEVNTTLRARCL